MKRYVPLALVIGLAGLASLGVWLRPSVAGPEQPDPGNGRARGGPTLPIGQVILYSSGVGYFQREGTVDGNARVDLSFPVQDINDLLKSMVLRDLGGGHVALVSYDNQAPVERTLKSFAINLHNNPGFGQILNQARGEKVEVVLLQSNATQPGTLTGAVLGIEKQKQPAGKDGVVEAELLNLWCADGIRSVKLADVQRVRFLNPVLDSEVKKALETLAASHDTQKKAVSLAFHGDGKREVRVGYVIETPIWKTSYRLVLGKEGKPYLQGWAVVENPSDEDWTDVRMALVSGRPISFQMDLYQPLYVPRPTVVPELFASLRPPTHEGALGIADGAGFAGGVGGKMPAPAAPKPADGEDKVARQQSADAPTKAEGYFANGKRSGLTRLDSQLDLRDGAQSVATTAQLGDYFQYLIEKPVTLARQKSALLPIVNKDVAGERVSIYNEGTHAKFPLLGLRFKNTTGVHLMQGPITVFEGASYAGDARILDVQPNEERLVSYAVDLGTEVAPVVAEPRHTLTKVKAHKGILHTTTRVVESKTYKVANRSEQDRTVLIEHPLRDDFKITSKERPQETTRDVHRFEMKVPAGQSASLTVTEEKDLGSQIQFTNAGEEQIRFFLHSDATSDAVKQALRKALELKAKAARTRQELAHANQQLADIERDQTRLRANLKETPPTANAYKKYLQKLDEQETEVDQLRARIKALQTSELEQRQAYEVFLAGLDVE